MESKTYSIRGESRAQVQLLLWIAPAFAVLIIGVAIATRPKGSDRAIVASLLTVAIASIPFALWARSALSGTIEVNDESVIYRRGKNATTIRWSDVRTLENRRRSQRLKVFATSGAVINVEYQIAGFQELADLIAARSGRSINGPRRSMEPLPTQGDIEIATPEWFRYLFFAFVPAAAYFFCVRFFVVAWRLHNRGYILFGVLGGWLVAKAIRGWWHRLAMRLRMDASGIHFRSRKEAISLAWANISTAQLEHTGGNTWFIVRDREGEPRLALPRNVFNWSGGALKRFDRLAAAARARTVSPSIM